MITAKEAVALFDHAGKAADDYLKHAVEPKVAEAAKIGKRNITIFLGNLPVYEIHNLKQRVDPLYVAAGNKLTELGYIADLQVYGEPYVPPGLMNESDESGPHHKNYGLHIRW